MLVHTCVTECAWNARNVCCWWHDFEGARLVVFMFLVYTCMPGESCDSSLCHCFCVTSVERPSTPFLLIVHKPSAPRSVLDCLPLLLYTTWLVCSTLYSPIWLLIPILYIHDNTQTAMIIDWFAKALRNSAGFL